MSRHAFALFCFILLFSFYFENEEEVHGRALQKERSLKFCKMHKKNLCWGGLFRPPAYNFIRKEAPPKVRTLLIFLRTHSS